MWVIDSEVQQTLQAIGQGLGLTRESAFMSSFKSRPATPGGQWPSKVDSHDAVTWVYPPNIIMLPNESMPIKVMVELVLLELGEGIKTGILWIEGHQDIQEDIKTFRSCVPTCNDLVM
ncbi:hypothetical protein P691DRAFT_780683 [Macrolepiota fuliginosa MF-IS2]|uniref:Uncharacterized protein n=1 Tax=Macrolepiota fuliginosa MF-IS2 TaxID=1400762 RepID=A0A9P5WY85_9AGAR|nr:hypothetical protein P691DRAFT_780683 [Macrolepiota fuliginosa MF-IS2]